MTESYRPQKKKIDPSEVAGPPSDDMPSNVAPDPEENQAALAELAQIRKAAETRVDPSTFNPTDTFNNPDAAFNNPDGGIKTTGPIPEQLKQAMGQQSNSGTPLSNEQPDIRMTGSSRLEELINGIAQTSTYDEVTLPSLGKFYMDGPANGIVHMRPMTGEEEQILATPRFVRKGQAINMIFNKCIQESYDAGSFLSEDRTFLLIYLRGISYTPEYEVEINCPECERKFATVIDLNAIYVDECPRDFGPGNLEGVLPTSGYKFTYRLAVGSDEQRIADYRDRRIRGFDTANMSDDSLLYRNALLVNDIEGLTDKTEIQQLLRKLPINDVSYLRNTVNNPPFGPDTDISITCDSCLHEFEVELPLEANFFFPRSRKTT